MKLKLNHLLSRLEALKRRNIVAGSVAFKLDGFKSHSGHCFHWLQKKNKIKIPLKGDAVDEQLADGNHLSEINKKTEKNFFTVFSQKCSFRVSKVFLNHR